MQIPSDYYSRLSQIESANKPYARATTSTASGLYQFTKDTWEALGGVWGRVSGAAFGGARPSVEEQHNRVVKLTTQNATALERVGVAINNATLYAAHFLGITGAKRILSADPNTPIESVTSAAQRRANPSILKSGSTAGDFFAWLQRKTGASVTFQNSGPISAENAVGRVIGGTNPLLGAIWGGIGGSGGFGEEITDFSTNVVETVTGPFDWLKETFTMRNGSRLISIILGIALVIVAIVVLANSSDSLKLEAPSPVGA